MVYLPYPAQADLSIVLVLKAHATQRPTADVLNNKLSSQDSRFRGKKADPKKKKKRYGKTWADS